MNDLQRVFCFLDNRVDEYKPDIKPIRNAIDEAARKGEEYKDEYFNIKLFKNGNAHIKFNRLDLLDKVNELIADYYGATLGDGR